MNCLSNVKVLPQAIVGIVRDGVVYYGLFNVELRKEERLCDVIVVEAKLAELVERDILDTYFTGVRHKAVYLEAVYKPISEIATELEDKRIIFTVNICEGNSVLAGHDIIKQSSSSAFCDEEMFHTELLISTEMEESLG